MKELDTDFSATFWDVENSLAGEGHVVAGVDEVGRGCLAGPVFAAAVVLGSQSELWHGLNDSKKLSKSRRETLYQLIVDNAAGIGIGVAEVSEIEELNILHASRLAMARAIRALQIRLAQELHILLVDGTYEPLWQEGPIVAPSETVIDGDAKCPSISAASIVAKVARDRFMGTLANEYPAYGFERNVGYGTKEHLAALQKYGPCIHHRRSFRPVAQHLQSELKLYG
ncbi:ribonuclease HII [Alicyclobacillus sp. SO9]|nr:ribonuclease HII [Alicyclobacillus sp. SO9]